MGPKPFRGRGKTLPIAVCELALLFPNPLACLLTLAITKVTCLGCHIYDVSIQTVLGSYHARTSAGIVALIRGTCRGRIQTGCLFVSFTVIQILLTALVLHAGADLSLVNKFPGLAPDGHPGSDLHRSK
jgi:hypothetical protein